MLKKLAQMDKSKGITWNTRLDLQGPVKIVDWIMKENPLGTRIRAVESLWQAVSQAILNASVSSVMPSPAAPNFLTSKTPLEFVGLSSLWGGCAGSGSGTIGLGSGEGEGGCDMCDPLWWWECLCFEWCRIACVKWTKQSREMQNNNTSKFDKREGFIF